MKPTITITASGYAQSGNLILVSSGTSVTYTVSASEYNTKSGTVTVSSNETISASLVPIE